LFLSLQLTSQAWEQLNDTPFLKHHSNGFGFEDKAYIFEGTFENDGPQGISNEVWEYDPSVDSWTRLEDFPGEGRSIAIGDDWNGKYYYGFGRGVGGAKNDLWVFDPVDKSHRQLPSCPAVGRAHPALIAHNDKIHMGSGTSDNGDVDDWWEFDIATEVWTQLEDIPGGNRHHPFFFAHENKVYLGGGHRFNWLSYDLETGDWEEINNEPAGRVAGSQLTYKGKGLLVGGDDANHVHVPDFETFMSYDPTTDSWTYLPQLPNGSRWACSSFIINDQLYYFGGLSDFMNGDVSMWKFDLTFIDCLPVQGLSATTVSETTASIIWSASNNTTISDTLKWREVGSDVWNDVPNPQAVLVIDGLTACQEYEMVFISECESLVSNTEAVIFKTDGCCENPELQIASVQENSINLSWPSILAADGYTLSWREVGTTEWLEETVSGLTFEIPTLSACTEYEISILTQCTDGVVDQSEIFVMSTKGCGACLDFAYCDAPSQFDGELIYINEVRINDYVNTSGNDGGYGNFVVRDGESVAAGEEFEIYLEPGITTQGFASTFIVWIDYDANGTFEASEMAYQVFNVSQAITKTLTMPADASVGLTRMRVSFGINADPCEVGAFTLGEAEDYCLIVDGVSSTFDKEELNELVVYPNPSNTSVQVSGEYFLGIDTESKLVIRDAVGETYLILNRFNHDQVVDISNMPNGLYFLTVENGDKSKTVKIIKQD